MSHTSDSHQSTQSIADYLAQLLKDRKQLAAFPNVFNHVERLLDEGKMFYHYFTFNVDQNNKIMAKLVSDKSLKLLFRMVVPRETEETYKDLFLF